jgi:uncharacterized protein (DUF736 family)
VAYDDTNRGALFKNEKKKSDKSPDFTGKLNVDGKDYRLAGWFKVSKGGLRYTSLSVTPEESQERPDAEGDAQQADSFQGAGKSDW